MKRKIIKWISGKTFFATLAFLGLSIGAANAQITITTTSLPNGYIFSAYNETLTATGYTGIRWSISAGNLPDGLTLNSVSGVISGTPTATGTFNFTVKATEAMGGGSDSKSLSITIENQVWQIGAPNAADLTATLDASSTLAPMIAARLEDVGFIVMLAGTGIRGDKLGLMQQELLNRAVGTSEVEIAAFSKITARQLCGRRQRGGHRRLGSRT